MDGLVGDRILRCSDGHLFTSSQTGRVLASFHFGPKRLIRCPVDGALRLASNVDSANLTPEKRAEARRYRM